MGAPAARKARHRITERAASGAVAVLAALLLVPCAYAVVSSAMKVDRIQGDFCSWAAVHVRAFRNGPLTLAKAADKRSDAELYRQLGCAARKGKP